MCVCVCVCVCVCSHTFIAKGAPVSHSHKTTRWAVEIKVKDEVGAPLACMCCDVVMKLYDCEVETNKMEGEGVA